MDKYLHYTVEELVVDESFINYVKELNSKDIDFWKKWENRNPSKKAILAKAKSIVTKITIEKLPIETKKKEAVWKNIKTATTLEETNQKVNKKKRSFIPWLAAAAAVLALVYFSIGFSDEINIRTEIAEQNQVILPDGSLIDLNASSDIRYHKRNFKTNRKIELTGEAFFTVEKGSSFTVLTSQGEVEVLGTSFNIFVRDDNFKVACESGKVAVRANGSETILIADEKVIVVGKTKHMKLSQINLSRSDWKNGLFHYDGNQLEEIVKDIERQMGIEITIEKGLEKIQFSGSFKTVNLDSLLSEVCWPLGLSFDVKGKNVKIFKK